MPKKKNLGKKIFEEASKRASSEAASRERFLKSNFRARLESFIPSSLRWLFPLIEEFRREEALEEEAAIAPTPEISEPKKLPSEIESLYRKYPCTSGDPLSCDRARQIDPQHPEKYCQECGFPATLPAKAEILGSRGRYRLETFIKRRGMGRIYAGVRVSDSRRVVIKEYLLPERYFNSEEISQRQQTFERVAGVNLADGRVQDFRLIQPWDAIADRNEERCYLVTRGDRELFPTLREYLAINGAMTPQQVRFVLNQVLQTLEFLHTQKFRLPSGHVQHGIAHGNLALNSLLIDPENSFIYLCDLALWERLFDPSLAEIPNPSPARDLVDLGYLSFYLLAGGTVHPVSGEPLNPQDEQQWPPVDFPLQGFILKLLGLSLPFESAEAARQALLKLPLQPAIAGTFLQKLPETEEKVKSPRPIFWLLWGLSFALLGALIWLLLSKPQASESAGDDLLLCCIKEVAGVPAGSFTYGGDREGTWSYVLTQENLIARGSTLEQELIERQPKLQLNYQPEASGEDAIAKVRLELTDFAVSSLAIGLSPDLGYKEFAYDGIVAFVPFSYSQREKGLPQALKGEISFETLRKLYTGEVENWKQIGGPDLPVKLYIPTDSEAVKIFEQRVLQEDRYIRRFRTLWKKEEQSDSFYKISQGSEIVQLSAFPLLRKVIQDFERDGTGAIAFAPLSQVFGQCSVYPLALIEGEKAPVQVLVQDSGKPVDPTTDLCNDKGSYRPDREVFTTGRYPLGYAIAAVYPRDNSRPPAGIKFAEMLRTEEGQQLLSKTGLVPLYSTKRN